jgi:hypothetical protein
VKDQLPAPDFDADRYERPNQNWICGKAVEGKPCRVGPSGGGRCRATFECKPLLEIKEGETKGRYRCTRPTEYGGPCAHGPQPDGTCSRAITKCVPIRSLRGKRKVFTIGVVAATAGILLVALCGPFRGKVVNPGALSLQHSTEAFAKMANEKSGRDPGCAACHKAAKAGPTGWLSAGFSASPGPFQFRQLAAETYPAMNSIDQNCEHCHTQHSFHEPNVPRDHSCSACHQEHRGSGWMKAPTDANCLSCHANVHEMQLAIDKAKSISAEKFDYRPALGRTLFKTPRPEQGYTKIIHSFAKDHPEFQLIAENLKDLNTLKFNHELHLTSQNVPTLNGKKLECADCHKPDASGIFYLKFNFEENCRACHSLQFDVHNPDLRLPHGRSEHVRAFLRSLPDQYAELARGKGITERRDIEEFVQEQVRQIRQDSGSGEVLEEKIFFSDAKRGPVARVGNLSSEGAARFPGCAYCHQVTSSQGSAPIVTPPVIPDRWLVRSRFDHGKHFKVSCEKCHDVKRSRDTSDILLPSKRTCVECHSPQGGVANNCSTCHSYHSPRREIVAER